MYRAPPPLKRAQEDETAVWPATRWGAVWRKMDVRCTSHACNILPLTPPLLVACFVYHKHHQTYKWSRYRHTDRCVTHIDLHNLILKLCKWEVEWGVASHVASRICWRVMPPRLLWNRVNSESHLLACNASKTCCSMTACPAVSAAYTRYTVRTDVRSRIWAVCLPWGVAGNFTLFSVRPCRVYAWCHSICIYVVEKVAGVLEVVFLE